MTDPAYSIVNELAQMVTIGGGWAFIFGFGIGVIYKMIFGNR